MKILKWLDKNFEYTALALLLAVMTVLSFTNVVMRYCFKSPIYWSDEVCCYCLALSTFFCLPVSIRFSTAIRVDTFVGLFPKKVQTALRVVCHIIMLAFLTLCVYGGFGTALNAAGQTSPALQIPVDVLYYIMTVCFMLAVLRTVQAIILELKPNKEDAAA